MAPDVTITLDDDDDTAAVWPRLQREKAIDGFTGPPPASDGDLAFPDPG